MGIDWEVEEGHHEFDKEDGKHTVSVHPAGDCVDVYGTFNFEEIEATYLKMKELQSPNKDIEFLQADIASLGYLLDMSIESDPIGKIQLSSRLETRKRELKELQSEVKK